MTDQRRSRERVCGEPVRRTGSRYSHWRFLLRKNVSKNDQHQPRRRSRRRTGHCLGIYVVRKPNAALVCGFVNLVGSSESLRHVREFARRIARGDAKVLITGESGVGKDSSRASFTPTRHARRGPFVAINCAGLAGDAARVRAVRPRQGQFHRRLSRQAGPAPAGRPRHLFLDEVGEMTLRCRRCCSGSSRPARSSRSAATRRPARVDVRVIAATNRNLPALGRDGQFREDLLYRIGRAYRTCRRCGIGLRTLSRSSPTRSRGAAGPSAFPPKERFASCARIPAGNIRELQNVVEQVSWVADQNQIGPEHLPAAIATSEGMIGPPDSGSRLRTPCCSRAGPPSGETLHPQSIRRIHLSRSAPADSPRPCRRRRELSAPTPAAWGCHRPTTNAC